MAPLILDAAFVHNKGGKIKPKKVDKQDTGRPHASSVWRFARASVESRDTARPRPLTAELTSARHGLSGNANLEGQFAKVLEFQSLIRSLETCGKEYREAMIRLRLASQPMMQHLKRACASNVALGHMLTAFASQIDSVSTHLDDAHSAVEEMLQLVQHSLAECDVVCSAALRSEDSLSLKRLCDKHVHELTHHVGPQVTADEKSSLLRKKFLADKVFAQRLLEFEEIVCEFLDRCMEDLGQMLSHFCIAQSKFVSTEMPNGFADLADRFADFDGSLHASSASYELVKRSSSVHSGDHAQVCQRPGQSDIETSPEVDRCRSHSDALPAAPTTTMLKYVDVPFQSVLQEALSPRMTVASSMSPMETLPVSSVALDGLAVAPRDTLPMGSVGSAARQAHGHPLPSLLGRTRAQPRAGSLEFEAVKSIPLNDRAEMATLKDTSEKLVLRRRPSPH